MLVYLPMAKPIPVRPIQYLERRYKIRIKATNLC